jgi:hypothetical protein
VRLKGADRLPILGGRANADHVDEVAGVFGRWPGIVAGGRDQHYAGVVGGIDHRLIGGNSRGGQRSAKTHGNDLGPVGHRPGKAGHGGGEISGAFGIEYLDRHDARIGSDPGNADLVVRRGGNGPRYMGTVPGVVVGGRQITRRIGDSGQGVVAGNDTTGEFRIRRIEPGIEHGHDDRAAAGGMGPGGSDIDGGQVALEPEVGVVGRP